MSTAACGYAHRKGITGALHSFLTTLWIEIDDRSRQIRAEMFAQTT